MVPDTLSENNILRWRRGEILFTWNGWNVIKLIIKVFISMQYLKTQKHMKLSGHKYHLQSGMGLRAENCVVLGMIQWKTLKFFQMRVPTLYLMRERLDHVYLCSSKSAATASREQRATAVMQTSLWRGPGQECAKGGLQHKTASGMSCWDWEKLKRLEKIFLIWNPQKISGFGSVYHLRSNI